MVTMDLGPAPVRYSEVRLVTDLSRSPATNVWYGWGTTLDQPRALHSNHGRTFNPGPAHLGEDDSLM